MNCPRLLFVALALAGCDGSSPAPLPTAQLDSTPIRASSPLTMPDPIAAVPTETPAKPDDVQPSAKASTALHLSEIVHRVDLRKIQPMDGMTLSSAAVDQWNGSLPASASKTPEQVLEYLESRLLESGCERSSQSDLDSNDPQFPSRVYQHGDLLLEAGASRVERFDAPPEIIAYLRVLGNLDLRTLTWPQGVEIRSAGQFSVQLRMQGGILEWRKQMSEKFTQAGWQEYRVFLPGVEIPVEDMVPSQAFLQNGMGIQFTYRDNQEELIKDQDANGVINCLVGLSVVPYEPILPGPVKSLKMRWSPFAMVFETSLPPEQTREQLERLYSSQGYQVTIKPSADTSTEAIHMVCSHADLLDVEIEFQKSGKTTLVVINELR